MYIRHLCKILDICTKIVFINSKLSFLQSINIEHEAQEEQHQYGRICIKVAAQVLWHLLILNLYSPYIILQTSLGTNSEVCFRKLLKKMQ